MSPYSALHDRPARHSHGLWHSEVVAIPAAIPIKRWALLPRWARWVLAVYVIGFIEGTIDHVRWMAHGGIHAYAGFGYVPVQVFLVLLVVMDPVAALLCGAARRPGVWLAVLITVLDVAANWAGNWGRMPRFIGTFWLVELFTAFVLATAIPLSRAVSRAAGPCG